jgi:argininosuccinate lyase
MGLWGGRFSEPTDDDLRRLNDSLPFDQRMASQDIRGSVAYARALHGCGLLTQDEADTLIEGLGQVAEEIESSKFVFAPGDEDIHTAVERRLTEIVGDVGGKLHTGRSRNDQVATDFRLWVMDSIDTIVGSLTDFQVALVEQAEQHIETLMPGYTHLQPAQPITVAQWLMSFFWMVERDVNRLDDARKRTAVSPLGSGALAGNPLVMDRASLAGALGFDAVSENSLDAVSDRDFVAETLFALALLGTHLSRLAEDVIIFSNPAFGFIRLNDRYSTGSSLMPQKRNADPMELARGKSGRLIGNLVGLVTTLKGLPSGYNKDLQEDKEALFDSFDTLEELLPVVTAVVKTLAMDADRMRASLDPAMLATDLADYLVKKGIPFRQAHHVSGEVVALAESRGVTLFDLSTDDLRTISDLFADDISDVLDFDRVIHVRRSPGGTAPDAVRQQIANARKRLTDRL